MSSVSVATLLELVKSAYSRVCLTPSPTVKNDCTSTHDDTRSLQIVPCSEPPTDLVNTMEETSPQDEHFGDIELITEEIPNHEKSNIAVRKEPPGEKKLTKNNQLYYQKGTGKEKRLCVVDV